MLVIGNQHPISMVNVEYKYLKPPTIDNINRIDQQKSRNLQDGQSLHYASEKPDALAAIWKEQVKEHLSDFGRQMTVRYGEMVII